MAERTPQFMQKNTIQFVRGLMIIPFLTTGSPFAILQKSRVLSQNVENNGSLALFYQDNQNKESQEDVLRKEHIKKIDLYFEKRNMPLKGYGEKLIAEAEKNNLDWRILPAIAIKETTGGKFACHNNLFGWGSCKIKFENWNESIETVARNLGGNNPKTEKYYKDKTTTEKLLRYNSEIPTYTKEIYEFMELIENEK